jgi:hypothetical protein
MALPTRADAGDHSATTLAQATVPDAGLGYARLSDLSTLNQNGPTYLQNDRFQIADNSGNPATRISKAQEFEDAFDHLGRLYSDSVIDDGRSLKFKERMEGVYRFDRDTFRALGNVGDQLIAKPPATPEQVGKQLADIFTDTLKRHGGSIDLSEPEWLNLQSAMAGVMIAAGSTFNPETKAQQNIAMVDAMDAQLRTNNIPYVNAIIWGDTKEPGMAVVPPGQTLTQQQRHNFQ